VLVKTVTIASKMFAQRQNHALDDEQRAGREKSAAQSESLDQLLIFGRTRRLQIIEQLAALIDQLHQAAARGMVALVGNKMLTQSVDALRQERNLHFRRSSIFGIAAVLSNDTALLVRGQSHRLSNLFAPKRALRYLVRFEGREFYS